MECPKCKANEITFQVVQDGIKTKTKHKGFLHKFGRFMLILCTCGLWLLIPKAKETSTGKTETHKEAICQKCGYSWKM